MRVGKLWGKQHTREDSSEQDYPTLTALAANLTAISSKSSCTCGSFKGGHNSPCRIFAAALTKVPTAPERH